MARAFASISTAPTPSGARPRAGSQTFFEWCLTVTPGACSKTDPTLLPLGFFGTVFFGFLGSRPDRFCPFAIVASNRDCLWMMMRYSQIKWLVPAYLRADAGEQSA